jgi:S1-C subfamily serine protease
MFRPHCLLKLGAVTALALSLSALASSCGGAASQTSSTPGKTSTSRTTTESPGAPSAVELPLPDLIQQIRSGIVRINVTGCGFSGTGTGLLVGPHEVVTVEHVVDGARTIKIEQGGKVLGKAIVIGADGARDLALLQTKIRITGHRFTVSAKAPRLGDSVAVIGYPLGLPLSVTKGTVSGLGRVVPIKRVKRRGLIQTDAAVNPGNSGGPLVLLPGGEVVGLVDLGSLKVNGIAFAVNGRVAAKLVDAWRASPQPLPSARCDKPSTPVTNRNDTSTSSEDFFQSPSGNIRCEYLNQEGIACMTLNNGLGVLLRSFDTSYYIDKPFAFSPPAGRMLSYGDTWSNSSFRCSSSTDGVECWSTLTGHGFFISRDTRNIY